MQSSRSFALAAALTCAAGCAALGWEFAPGFSARDGYHFASPPVIEHRSSGEYLVWTYGTGPFYASPRYRPINGRLVFSLQGTTSTGTATGRRAAMRIEGREALDALAQGGAYWWEPDRSFVLLERVSSE